MHERNIGTNLENQQVITLLSKSQRFYTVFFLHESALIVKTRNAEE